MSARRDDDDVRGSAPDTGAMNLAFVEELQERYLRHPQDVPAHWRRYFESLLAARELSPDWRPGPARDGVPGRDRVAAGERDAGAASLQARSERLFHALRARGHLAATVDPLGRPRPGAADIRPSYHGIREADLDCEILFANGGGEERVRLDAAVRRLRRAYCGTLGVEYEHVDDDAVRDWFRERVEEDAGGGPALGGDDRTYVLERLTEAQVFEEFVQRKFPGAKSFSLEGAVSLSPASISPSSARPRAASRTS